MVNEFKNRPLWSSRGRKYRIMIGTKGKNINDIHALDSAIWATVETIPTCTLDSELVMVAGWQLMMH